MFLNTQAACGPERGQGVAHTVVLTARGGESQRSRFLLQQGFEVRWEGTWAGQEEE